MEQKKLTDKQKAILTEKLQERLLGVAVPAMVKELEKMTGEKIDFSTSVCLSNNETHFPTVLFFIGVDKSPQNIFTLPVTFALEDIPNRTIAFFSNHLEKIFLPF